MSSVRTGGILFVLLGRKQLESSRKQIPQVWKLVGITASACEYGSNDSGADDDGDLAQHHGGLPSASSANASAARGDGSIGFREEKTPRLGRALGLLS